MHRVASGGRGRSTAPSAKTRVTPGLIDPPCREDHAGYHGFTRGLLDHEPYVGSRGREHHFDPVASLHLSNALADQPGREAVTDDLLGVRIIDVLSVLAHPYP